MTETPDTRPAPEPEPVETLPAPLPEGETKPAPLPDDHHDLRPAPEPEAKGVTPSGWPYVTPDDHPKEYPAHSQQLAEKLEATAVVCGESTVTGDAFGVASVPIPAGYALASATSVGDTSTFLVIRGYNQVGMWQGTSRLPSWTQPVRWVAAKS